jgi:hypothetical protein
MQLAQSRGEILQYLLDMVGLIVNRENNGS